MASIGKPIRTGVAAALLLASLTTGAQGFAPGGTSSFGGESRGMMQIRGTVLCEACSLEEMRTEQPNVQKLYQLSHTQGQVVMQIATVNGSAMFDPLAQPSRLQVRARAEVFEKLSAEENLAHEVEITGILRNTRTLDIATVTIFG